MLQKVIRENKSASITIILILIASMFIIPALYVAGSSTLLCQRVEATQVNCTITDNRWLGFVPEIKSVPLVKEVQEYARSCRVGSGDKSCRNITFVTNDEDIGVSLPREWVGDINKFLQSTEPTFTLTRDNNSLSFGFVGMAFVASLIFGGFMLSRQPKIRSSYHFKRNITSWSGQQGKSVTGSFLIIFIAVIFMLIGVYLVGNNTLSCQRVESTQVNCVATENRWFGQMPRLTLELNQVTAAKSINTKCPVSFGRGTQRVACQSLVLITSGNEIQPNIVLNDAADQMNQFLQSTQPTLTITVQDWVRGAIFGGIGGIILLAGLMVLALSIPNGSNQP